MKAIAASFALASLAACAGGSRMDERSKAYLGSAAEPSAVIAAELAFARMAREKGTWAAFRATASDDAIWPGPQLENVKASLKGAPDPAQAIVWEPDSVWVSCDGSFALSTGPGTWPSGKTTRFATIWQRQDDDRYRWVLDQSFDLEAGYAKPEMIGAQVAECTERQPGAATRARRTAAWQTAQSDDGTLSWATEMRADCSRTFVVRARRSGTLQEVFRRNAAAPAPVDGKAPACSA